MVAVKEHIVVSDVVRLTNNWANVNLKDITLEDLMYCRQQIMVLFGDIYESGISLSERLGLNDLYKRVIKEINKSLEQELNGFDNEYND